MLKKQFEFDEIAYKNAKALEESQMSDAKSKLGVFSEIGVQETRDLFWMKFAQGKGFAKRQTKWDAAMLGMR